MPPRKKTRSRRPSAKARGRRQVRILLGAAFLFAFLVASLVILSQVRRTLQPPVPPPSRETKTAPSVAMLREQIRSEIEGLFWRAGIRRDLVTQKEEGGTEIFDISAAYPPPATLKEFRNRLARVSADLVLKEIPAKKQLDLQWRSELAIRLIFRPPVTAPAGPRIGIIMDDMGRDLSSARRLLAIGLPVALAILPSEPHAREVGELAHRKGREVLLHIPMEPQSYPVTDPGRDALFLQYSREEIRRRIKGYLTRVPYVVGGNNHMGSRFTESEEGMEAVLQIMKESGLFFVDSVTTGHSLAFDQARKRGVPAAARDVFLDNVPEVPAIHRQIEHLATLATKQGQAIAICHPYPETLEALEEIVPILTKLGIEVVPVSDLLIR